MNCLRVFLVLLFSLSYVLVNAQVPSDLSNVKASQISDNQLQLYLNQAKASGLTVEQLEAEFLRRGLPQTEMAEPGHNSFQWIGYCTACSGYFHRWLPPGLLPR